MTRQWMDVWAENPLERRKFGVFYTPEAVANRVVEVALVVLGREPAQVLEPSCGSGAFLSAYSEAAATTFGWTSEDLAERLLGVELDPIAADIAQRGTAARIVNADFLGEWWDESAHGTFDLIIGNPPFGGAIRKDTGRSDHEKAWLRERFPLSAVGAYDRSALFVERALELLSDDGVLAFVLPRHILASPSAAGIRHELAKRRAPSIIELDDSNLFDSADVHVCGLIAGGASDIRDAKIYGASSGSTLYQSRQFSKELTSWSPLVDGTSSLVLAGQRFPTLGSLLDISASAATAEAYDWAPSVCEDVKRASQQVGESGKSQADAASKERADSGHSSSNAYDENYRLVISGSIDPFENLWGTRTTRYLGQNYERPVISRSSLSERRADQAASPKILMPGLSRCLEAAIDVDGLCVGAVATQTIRPLGGHRASRLELLRIAAVLNSAWCRLQYRANYASTALSGGNIAVSRNKLREITVLPEWEEWLSGDLLSDVPADSRESRWDEDRMSDHLRAMKSELENAGLTHGLRKSVCSPVQFEQLANVARKVSSTFDFVTRLRALEGGLLSNPTTLLDTGVMDVLLLSIAQSSLELVAPRGHSGE